MSEILAFTSKYKLNNIKVEDLLFHIQNASLFIISISSLFACLYYNMHDVTGDGVVIDKVIRPFDLLIPVVGVHASIDFFVTKSYDLKLHHVFVLVIIFYNYYHNVVAEDKITFLYPLLKTEISSIFYVLKYCLPKNSIMYNINNLLFYGAFLKFRVYDYYYELISNQNSFDIVSTYSQPNYYTYTILVASCWGLYLLNIYWFLIITKIAYKSIAKIISIDTDMMCHYLCSYIYWVNIPLSFYIYSNNPHEKNMLDMFGVISLSISSYMYHYDIYNRLYKNEIKSYINPDKKNIILFFNDNIFINLRSFLIIATNYYNHPLFIPVIIISGSFHIFSMYYIVTNIFNFLINYDDEKGLFINRHNILTGIPIAVDVAFICANSSLEIAMPFLLVHITMAFLFIIEPFYKLTHVAFHTLLIAQNYYVCSSSIKS
jgi:hypothetical protein